MTDFEDRIHRLTARHTRNWLAKNPDDALEMVDILYVRAFFPYILVKFINRCKARGLDIEGDLNDARLV